MTLRFYSAKAYRYVRKTFDLGLPDPSTVSKWYNVIDGEAGFTEEALTAVKQKCWLVNVMARKLLAL